MLQRPRRHTPTARPPPARGDTIHSPSFGRHNHSLMVVGTLSGVETGSDGVINANTRRYKGRKNLRFCRISRSRSSHQLRPRSHPSRSPIELAAGSKSNGLFWPNSAILPARAVSRGTVPRLPFGTTWLARRLHNKWRARSAARMCPYRMRR